MQELIKYQELDSKLRKLNATLNNNENRAKANQMQQFMRDTQTKIIALDDSAAKTVELVKKLKAEQEKAIDKIEALLKSQNADLEKSEAEAVKLAEVLMKLERDLSNVQNKLIAINKEFEGLMKNAKTAKSNLMFYKQEFDKAKQTYAPQIEALEREMTDQKKKVKPELMAKYQSKSEGKIFPIFVPLTSNRCGGCHMDIPVGKIKDIESHGFIECENCGRFVYKA